MSNLKVKAGKVGMNLVGEYSSTNLYKRLDVVSYNGSSYSALKETIGHIPTDTDYWQLIAEKGEKGDMYELNDKDKEEIEDVVSEKTNAKYNQLNDNVNVLQGKVNGLASGSPKGTYATIEDLKNANPETGVYIVTANGHIYSWTKNQEENPIDLGVYQATGNSQDYNYQITLSDYGNVNEGKYVNYNAGDIQSLSGVNASDYVSITNSCKIKIENLTYRNSADARGLAYYDEDKNFISGYQYPEKVTSIETIAPTNAKFVRFTYYQAQEPIVLLIHKNEEIINAINSPDITNKILNSTTIDITNYLNNNKYQSGFILQNTGGVSDYIDETMYFTDYYPIEQDMIVKLSGFQIKPDNRGIAFYNENLEYISGSKYILTSFDVTAPTNAKYFALTLWDAITPTIKIAGNYQNMINLSNRLPLTPTINPTKYKGNKVRTFNKLLAIGDSLTAGVFNHNDSGSTEYVAIPEYSYPSQIKKATGIEVDNLGQGGLTTKQWYERQASLITSGHDFCIINLGANDTQANRATTSEVNTYLTNIINKVKTENPKIKIFIADLLPCYYFRNQDWYHSFRAVMKTVAEDNNCYFLDLSIFSACRDNTIYAQGHLTALGYQKEAEELMNYISYVIDKNINDFKYVQFIGTDYEYNE